jgi:hypothetical protein
MPQGKIKVKAAMPTNLKGKKVKKNSTKLHPNEKYNVSDFDRKFSPKSQCINKIIF